MKTRDLQGSFVRIEMMPDPNKTSITFGGTKILGAQRVAAEQSINMPPKVMVQFIQYDHPNEEPVTVEGYLVDAIAYDEYMAWLKDIVDDLQFSGPKLPEDSERSGSGETVHSGATVQQGE